MISFEELRRANRERLPLFGNVKGEKCHNSADGEEWRLSQWANAVTGEIGELCTAMVGLFAQWGNTCNRIKKGEQNFNGADARAVITSEQITLEAIANEIADVIIYLDILALRLNLDLGACVRDKFNKTSNKYGSDVKINFMPFEPDSDIVKAHQSLARFRSAYPAAFEAFKNALASTAKITP